MSLNIFPTVIQVPLRELKHNQRYHKDLLTCLLEKTVHLEREEQCIIIMPLKMSERL